MYLRDHYFFDASYGPQAVIDAKRAALAQPFNSCVDLMKNLLEPKLVRLMDGNKEQFVVAHRFRQRHLQRQQFRNLEVFVVRKRGVFAVFGCHKKVCILPQILALSSVIG